MFHSFVIKTAEYLKNHPRYTFIYVFVLLLGCVYLFQLNKYVLEETSIKVLGKEVEFMHVKNDKEQDTYREITSLAEKLENKSELLMDAIEQELLPVISVIRSRDEGIKKSCEPKEI